ncbi:basic secretory protein-like protein [Anatilimnocola floriformis]|uniref:basic secretory protein-like protein n=1 Tax=Anatilimnocola floriformis TaxID=2948575 RepID=UPI0020C43D9D|nr:basic secretory protein-like protein [Anatilimnocola floriformis]
MPHSRRQALAALLLSVPALTVPLLAQEEPKAEPKPELKTETKPESKTEDKPERPRTPPPLRLTIEGDVSGDMGKVAGNLTTLFYDCYPKLLKRFENEEKFAARSIKIEFKKGIKVPAYAHRDTITVSTEWLEKHPEDIGLLTHELTHLVQAYPNSDPGWLTEGIADYARHVYGPPQQRWAIPRRLRPEQSYKNSYGVTAKFLVWVDEKFPGTVDKIHRRMQANKFELEDFTDFTGKDVDTLWRECVMELNK